MNTYEREQPASRLSELTDEDLAAEIGTDLPVREAMTVLDLGGMGGRVLPPFLPVEEPGPAPIVPNEALPA